MVMGNASGRKDGEGPSGAKQFEECYEAQQQYYMEYGEAGEPFNYQAQGILADPFPSHTPMAFQPSLYCTPQVLMVPWPRPGEAMKNADLVQYTTYNEVEVSETQIPALIKWTHGGREVAVVGSWDNWKTRVSLQRSGEEFTIIKVLQPGVYHYRYVVDNDLVVATDLPYDSSVACNILDLQEYDAPEVVENRSEIEGPPSPDSSYTNRFFSEADFAKPPPDLPPVLENTQLYKLASSKDSHLSLPRPQHVVLNHLYTQNTTVGSQPVALGSTHRFLQKYVTVLLYKPLHRSTN